jgi:hypothetical protein
VERIRLSFTNQNYKTYSANMTVEFLKIVRRYSCGFNKAIKFETQLIPDDVISTRVNDSRKIDSQDLLCMQLTIPYKLT